MMESIHQTPPEAEPHINITHTSTDSNNDSNTQPHITHRPHANAILELHHTRRRSTTIVVTPHSAPLLAVPTATHSDSASSHRTPHPLPHQRSHSPQSVASSHMSTSAPHAASSLPSLTTGTASASAGSNGAFIPQPSPDLADERDSETIRSALESGVNAPPPLDLATLLKQPDKLKKACRLGIPMGQRRQVWNALFDMNTKPSKVDYTSTKLEVFNGVSHPIHFPHIPDFGSMMKWNPAYIHLTAKRINYAKTILCVIACTHPTLSHCPILPDLTCTLLIFYDESTTFELLQRMIQRSKHDEYYFTTDGGDFLRWTKTFGILLEQKNQTLHNHMLKTLKLDPSKLFALWLARFFVQYFPMRTVFRIIDSFLFEGNKILFRVALAILKLHTKELMQCKNTHAFLVKLHSCMTKQTSNELMSAGFDIYLSRTSHLEKIQTHLHENQSTLLANPPTARNAHFHIPRFHKEFHHVSELIGMSELYSLWNWLPPTSKIQDPILLYSSSVHGYSYQTLWERSCEAAVGETSAIFMLIHDASSQQVLGLFLNRPLPDPIGLKSSKSRGTTALFTGKSSGGVTPSQPLDPQSFIFVLKPVAEVYKHRLIKQQEREKEMRERKIMEFSVDESRNRVSGSSHVRENSEEKKIFRPYGLSKLHGEDGSYIDVDRNPLSVTLEEPNGGNKLAGNLDPSTAATVSLLTDRLYTNTIGAAELRNLHAAHSTHTPHPSSLHPHALSTDPSLSSSTMIVGPSRGMNKTQPLNELFASLEMNSPTSAHAQQTKPSQFSSGTSTSNTSSAVTLHFRPSVVNQLSSTDEASLLARAKAQASELSLSPSVGTAQPLPHSSAAALPAPALARSASSPEAEKPPPNDIIELHPVVPTKIDAPHGNAGTQHLVDSSAEVAPVDVGDAAAEAVEQVSAAIRPNLPRSKSQLTRLPSIHRLSSLSEDEQDTTLVDAMLLMTAHGFGIVETAGAVLFLSEDLKTGISGPSIAFDSPNFIAEDRAASAFKGKFQISAIEVWSFAAPGSEMIEQMSPRPVEK